MKIKRAKILSAKFILLYPHYSNHHNLLFIYFQNIIFRSGQNIFKLINDGDIMKKQHLILAVVLFTFIVSTTSFSQGSKSTETNTFFSTVEENYLEGLKSDNLGLRMSCAYFLGELKSSKAVIPLMNVLNSENHEGARIMAAWSLIKIGDPRGIHLVKQHSELCKDCSVQSMCAYFYYHYVLSSEGKLDLN